jgi:hypothetical protein
VVPYHCLNFHCIPNAICELFHVIFQS